MFKGFVSQFVVAGLDLDLALRRLMYLFRLPGEVARAVCCVCVCVCVLCLCVLCVWLQRSFHQTKPQAQKIDRVMRVFSEHYFAGSSFFPPPSSSWHVR